MVKSVRRLFVVLFCAVLLVGSLGFFNKFAVAGDAIAIREMNSPVFDGVVSDAEWSNATWLHFNFTFANRQSYRSDVYLGHNQTHFFVGAILHGVGPNPFTVPDKMVSPDVFFIYFDVDNDGLLTTPEDGKGMLNMIEVYHGETYWSSSGTYDEFWRPTDNPFWLNYWHSKRPEVNGKIFWYPDLNVVPNKTTVLGTGDYYSSTGDEHFEFSFPLSNEYPQVDGFQLKPGESKTMGFALEFYRQSAVYPENGTTLPDLYDYWPGEGFTPNVTINPSQWAKLSIDLTIPLDNFLNAKMLLAIALVVAFVIVITIRLRAKYKESNGDMPQTNKSTSTLS